MKKKWILFLSLLILLNLSGCESAKNDTTLEISASTDTGIPYFTITTNLPDETLLEVEVSKVVETGNGAAFVYDKEEIVSVKDGKAETGKFSDEGKSLSGSYSVRVSTLYMDKQPTSVQEATENGKKFKGKLVSTNEFMNDAIYVSNYDYFSFKYDENASVSNGEEKAVTDTMIISMTNNIPSKIETSVKKYTQDYSLTELTDVVINEDSGTDEEDDYIVLAYFTFSGKQRGEELAYLLRKYSDDFAANLCNDYDSVKEVCCFWETPNASAELVGTSKWGYERMSDGMHLTDSAISFKY